ncbi:MAG TPA: hypothetical protein VEX38_03135, partial [Fimbriimonadaceae bacterium]|nr:hypothetical protein [Fimbriimonadaceae bacterium]
MSREPRIDGFARGLDPGTTEAVRLASSAKTGARAAALARLDLDAARTTAAETKQYVLDHLPELLDQLEAQATSNGIQVHHAKDAISACDLIVRLCEAAGA